MKARVIMSFFLLGLIGAGFSQSAIVPVGGDAQSSSGGVSYTVGQVAVQTFSSNDAVSVSEGVQQTYKILTVGVDNYPQITLDAMVYPNPTDNYVRLQLNGLDIPADGLRANLYDGNGKLLQAHMVASDITLFQIGQYATGTYYMELRDSRRVLKTFKLVRR